MLQYKLRSLRTRFRGPLSLNRSVARRKVTPKMVTWAYRLFLDREPEDARMVAAKVSGCTTFEDLRREFLASEEFRQKNPPLHFPRLTGDEPAMEIEDVEATHGLPMLFEHIQRTWQHHGETEPHWSVVTAERFEQAHIEKTKDEFFNSGRQPVNLLFKTLERNGIDHSALCHASSTVAGSGRITRWLAEKFENVYAYDISLAHLQGAASHLGGRGVSNVALRHVRDVEESGSWNVSILFIH